MADPEGEAYLDRWAERLRLKTIVFVVVAVAAVLAYLLSLSGGDDEIRMLLMVLAISFTVAAAVGVPLSLRILAVVASPTDVQDVLSMENGGSRSGRYVLRIVRTYRSAINVHFHDPAQRDRVARGLADRMRRLRAGSGFA